MTMGEMSDQIFVEMRRGGGLVAALLPFPTTSGVRRGCPSFMECQMEKETKPSSPPPPFMRGLQKKSGKWEEEDKKAKLMPGQRQGLKRLLGGKKEYHITMFLELKMLVKKANNFHVAQCVSKCGR